MSMALLVDFGSTWTKVRAVDLEAARVVASAQGPSTVGSDITVGLEQALAALHATLGEVPRYRYRLGSSSAAGGLKMVTIGLVRELTAELSGVRAPLGEAISGSLTEVRVDRVDAQALLSYDALSRRSGERELSLSAEGERVRVRGSVRIGGQTLAAEAVSAVELRGDVLEITAERVNVGDERVDRAIERALQGKLDLRVPVSGLPYGLELTDVAVGPDGIRLQAAARDTVLTAR